MSVVIRSRSNNKPNSSTSVLPSLSTEGNSSSNNRSPSSLSTSSVGRNGGKTTTFGGRKFAVLAVVATILIVCIAFKVVDRNGRIDTSSLLSINVEDIIGEKYQSYIQEQIDNTGKFIEEQIDNTGKYIESFRDDSTSSAVSDNNDKWNPIQNSEIIKKWRQTIRDQCRKSNTVEDIQNIDLLMKSNDIDDSSSNVEVQRRLSAVDTTTNTFKTKRCQRVVLDFGANIGDTSGHIIDTGMIGCDRSNILNNKDAKTISLPHFNVTAKEFQFINRRNPLTSNIAKLMEIQNEIHNITNEIDYVGPEDYCYYGIEGNPAFTKRLQGIENYVMNEMKPRPIQHMHFFTESVGAGIDGPTKLYLDTINTEQNFWGSSIFQTHQDVRKSIDKNNGTLDGTIAADVMGYTIGTMMKMTLQAFDDENETNGDNNSKNNGVKNHLILKVDIEGGEFPLLYQAIQDNTLCSFAKDMGHTVDVYIEFHSKRVTGKHNYGTPKSLQKKLQECGITFRNLQAWWH